MSVLVVGVFFCEQCQREIKGAQSSAPRDGNEGDRIEIISEVRAQHQQDTGHKTDGEFRIETVVEPVIERKFVSPVGGSSKPGRRSSGTSLPADGIGRHQGPNRGTLPRLRVIGGGLEDEGDD